MQLLRDLALSLVGTPYVYGNQSPLSTDCSGLIFILLNSVGMAPREDLNADGLHRFYVENGIPCNPRFGALVFFGTKERVKHVGFCLDERRMLEAAGGNEWISSIEKAHAVGACVTINLISRRKDFIASISPNYTMCGWT